MRPVVAGGVALIALAVSGCASPPSPPTPAPLPLTVDNGVGSEHGSYAAESDGEMRGPAGERCVIFNWDRPLTRTLAVRVRSASCDSQERPGWMVCTEISRTIIPIAASNLKDAAAAAGQ